MKKSWWGRNWMLITAISLVLIAVCEMGEDIGAFLVCLIAAVIFATIYFISRTFTRKTVRTAKTETIQFKEQKLGNVTTVEENDNTTFLRFIALDFETTGLDGNQDRIIEIGAVLFEDGKPTKKFSTLVNPERHIPEEASAVNKIFDIMVHDAPKEGEAISRLVSFLGNAIDGETCIVAYNARFDLKFLRSALIRCGYDARLRYFDAFGYARKNLTGLESYKQTSVAEYLGLVVGDAHRALDDATVCGHIYLKINQKLLAEEENKRIKKEAERISAMPTEEEAEVCRAICKICDSSTDAPSFYRAKQYVEVYCGGGLAFKIKLGKKLRYLLMEKTDIVSHDLRLEESSTTEGAIYIRVPFTGSDITEIAPDIIKALTSAKRRGRTSAACNRYNTIKELVTTESQL